jgi:hypothetical protein
MSNLSLAQLHRALQLSEHIAKLEAELETVLSSNGTGPETGNGKLAPELQGKGKRTMSPSARARIAEAQKSRWAKVKQAKPEAPGEAKPSAKLLKKKRAMSPEARARIVAAQKARWAKFRKGKK